MLAASYTVVLPLNVPVSKKKKFWLNLNQYRNTHHQSLAKAKVNFHDIVAPRVDRLPRFGTINLVYLVYPGTEQLMDTSNVCSIQDKFFSDVLVTQGKIVDDNRKIVLSALYLYQEIDRTNPRVEAVIIPGDETSLVQWLINHVGYQQKEEPVQITITQPEIEESIRDFIKKKLTINTNQRIDIDLKATRGDEGYTAIIDIVDNDDVGEDAQPGMAAKQASAPASPAPKTERPAVVTRAPSKVVPKATPATSKAEAPAAAVEEKVAPAAEAKADEPVAEAEAEVAVEASADAAPKQSLFEKVQETATKVVSPDATEDSDPPAPARPSLFGGMTAPSNH